VTKPVVVTPEAKDDTRHGEAFFDSRRDRLGSEFVDEVLATLERIKLTPEGFGEVVPGVRALALHRFGYVVYYRVLSEYVEVLAILHGARHPDLWKSRA
jgi:toxin ParE1/3/4